MRREKNRPTTHRRNHWARRTHRVLGVTSLVFVAIIALSGLVLNHADLLDLGKRRAASPLLLWLYDIEAPPIEASFAAGSVRFASTATALYVEDKQLALTTAPLVGAVVGSNTVVVATAEEFLVTMPDGTLIERFHPNVPGYITGLGVDAERIVARIGDQFYLFDEQLMTVDLLISGQADAAAWSQPVVPSAELVQRIGAAALGGSLNWERVLGDLHSGRILPNVGRYIADIVALCLLYLCISGAVMWVRLRRRGGSSTYANSVDAK